MPNASFKGGKCRLMTGLNSSTDTVLAKQHITHICAIPHGTALQCRFWLVSGEDVIAIMDEADHDRVIEWFSNKSKE